MTPLVVPAFVHRASAALHAAADAWGRQFLLAVDAARFGVPADPSVVRWATGIQVTPRLLATLSGHERLLSAVVTTTDAAGRPVAVSGGHAEATVRVWDLATGAQTAVLRPSEDDAWALAVADLAGRPVVATGSYNGVIQVWDVDGGAPLGRVEAGGGDLVHALAAATVEDRPVVISTMATNDGDPDTYREWPGLTVSDLATGRPLRTVDTGHTGAVHVTTTVLDGRPVVVSGGTTDASLRVWDLGSGEAAGATFAGHSRGTAAITTAVVAGRPVLVAADQAGAVRRWDLATGAPVGDPLTGVAAQHLAVLDLAGRPAVVAAGRDEMGAWDAATGAVVVAPFVARGVGALAVSVVDGRPVAVTAMRDATVRVWDLTPSCAAAASADAASVGGAASAGGAVFTAGGAVVGVVTAVVDGRPVAVSAGEDRVHQWDLTARSAGAAHMARIPVEVHAVAVSQAEGRARFVGVGGTDVWCWEAGSVPERLATVPDRRLWSVATAVVRGRPVAVVGGKDGSWGGELRLIPLAGDGPGVSVPPPPVEVFGGHASFVTSVATAVVGGRAVAVAAGLTETVARVWDLGTGRQLPLHGHGAWIRAVATVGFAGRTHAVTGDVDGVLRQWDLRTCAQHGPALTGHTGTVNALATGLSGDDWPVAVSGGDDRTVRLWDLTTGEQIGRAWPLPEPVTAVAVAAGCVVVGFGFEVAVLETPVFGFPMP